MTEVSRVLWDACVLYRWLSKSPIEYTDHITQYVEDARTGKAEIFISSISLAELRPSVIKKPGYTPASIIREACAFIRIIDTSPDIMSLAGMLKDVTYICSTDLPKVKERSRILTTGDAIQLATGVWMKEYFGVQNLELHTFDDGKGKNSEVYAKTVPMLSYHNWCKGLEANDNVQLAVELKRRKPLHPSFPMQT